MWSLLAVAFCWPEAAVAVAIAAVAVTVVAYVLAVVMAVPAENQYCAPLSCMVAVDMVHHLVDLPPWPTRAFWRPCYLCMNDPKRSLLIAQKNCGFFAIDYYHKQIGDALTVDEQRLGRIHFATYTLTWFDFVLVHVLEWSTAVEPKVWLLQQQQWVNSLVLDLSLAEPYLSLKPAVQQKFGANLDELVYSVG